MIRPYRTAVKALCSFIAVLLALPVMPSRAAVATEGVCGDDLYWRYDKNVLTISGTGDMYDFVQKSSQNRPNEAPWRMLNTSVARVRIEEGVTGIGEYAFYNFAPLAEIEFPENSLKRIGKYAFSGCQYLRTVRFPDSLESVGTGAFSKCRALETADFGSSPASVAPNMFAGD